VGARFACRRLSPTAPAPERGAEETVRLAVRALLALLLAATAVLFALYGHGILKNLWVDDGGDSPASTYLLFGVPFVGLALACLAGAVLILRRRS